MTDKDDLVWQAYVKSVQAYEGKKTDQDFPATNSDEEPVEIKKEIEEKRLSLSSLSDRGVVKKRPQFLSSIHDIRRELKQVNLKVQGKLDLHGLTQADAYERTIDFIFKSIDQRRRLLLIITGKGSTPNENDERGVLKRSFSIWVESDCLSEYIQWYSFARPEHGGEGAYYVRLRKKKD
jgi:DNA-nicking Smr family endonuclease